MSCKSNVNLAPIPPIDCIKEIKTPIDMRNCLVEYDENYASIKKILDNGKNI